VGVDRCVFVFFWCLAGVCRCYRFSVFVVVVVVMGGGLVRDGLGKGLVGVWCFWGCGCF